MDTNYGLIAIPVQQFSKKLICLYDHVIIGIVNAEILSDIVSSNRILNSGVSSVRNQLDNQCINQQIRKIRKIRMSESVEPAADKSMQVIQHSPAS